MTFFKGKNKLNEKSRLYSVGFYFFCTYAITVVVVVELCGFGGSEGDVTVVVVPDPFLIGPRLSSVGSAELRRGFAHVATIDLSGQCTNTTISS